MNRFAVFVFLWASLSLVEMTPPNLCDRPEHGPLSIGKCAGQTMNVTAEQRANVMACAKKVFGDLPTDKSMPPKPEMKIRACGMICVGQVINLFDSAGKPVNDEMTKTAVTVTYPMEVSSKLATSLSTCASLYGKDLMMKEGDCGTYRDLLNCYLMEISKACHADFAMF